MTAQSSGPESLTAQDWQEILSSPTIGGSGVTTKSVPLAVSKIGDKHLKHEERKAVLSRVVLQIALTDSDGRLEFLGSLNPALTESDLDRIATVREQWLNGEGRDRLRGLALRCYEKEGEPNEMLPQVSSPEELNRLADLLSQTEITDKTPRRLLPNCGSLRRGARRLRHPQRTGNRTHGARPGTAVPGRNSG